MTRPSRPDPNDAVIARLRDMADLDPPAGLRRGIMAALPPRKVGVWTRLSRFLFQPQTITFVPAKWAPVLAGILLVAVIPRLTAVGPAGERVAEAVPGPQASLTLAFEHPDARQVALIGTFNHWTPDGRVKTERHGDRWIFHIDVDPGRHEYAFLVDGQEVVPDPRAAFHRSDGFGMANSIVYATANDANTI